MTTAIKLAGWEDLSSEVQTTFGEIGDAIAEKPFAIRPVARRILKWDGRKLPNDARRVVVGLKEAARTLIRFDTMYKAQLRTAPTIYLVGSFDTLEPQKLSPVMAFRGPYSNAPWVLRAAVWSPKLADTVRVPKFEVAGIDVLLIKATPEGGRQARVASRCSARGCSVGMSRASRRRVARSGRSPAREGRPPACRNPPSARRNRRPGHGSRRPGLNLTGPGHFDPKS